MVGSTRRRAFTLVELMIVVAIVGVLAVLAIYGVRKYIANSKTAEARNSLGLITQDAATAFEKESGNQDTVVVGSASNIVRALCPTSAPVPASPPAAQKYQSAPADWNNDPGWKCLKFHMEMPQYYSYKFTAANTSPAAASYIATANGDLNGDGVPSTFSVEGSVQGGSLSTSPVVVEVNPEE
jgi:type IV pilus assembly protein PilA